MGEEESEEKGSDAESDRVFEGESGGCACMSSEFPPKVITCDQCHMEWPVIFNQDRITFEDPIAVAYCRTCERKFGIDPDSETDFMVQVLNK